MDQQTPPTAEDYRAQRRAIVTEHNGNLSGPLAELVETLHARTAGLNRALATIGAAADQIEAQAAQVDALQAVLAERDAEIEALRGEATVDAVVADLTSKRTRNGTVEMPARTGV